MILSFLARLDSIGGTGGFFLFGALTLAALACFAKKVRKRRAEACGNSNRTSPGGR